MKPSNFARTVTCDAHVLPRIYSLAPRVMPFVRAPLARSVSTDDPVELMDLPIEILTAIFALLPPYARELAALTCRIFWQVRNHTTRHMVLYAQNPSETFYTNIFANRPNLSKIVLPAIGLSGLFRHTLFGSFDELSLGPCLHTAVAIGAMLSLDKKVELELCPEYHTKTPPTLLDVCRERKYTVTPELQSNGSVRLVRAPFAATSPVFYYMTDGIYSHGIASHERLEGHETALIMAVNRDIGGLCALQPKENAMCMQASALNCSGVRYQTKRTTWVLHPRLSHENAPKRLVCSSPVRDANESDDDGVDYTYGYYDVSDDSDSEDDLTDCGFIDASLDDIVQTGDIVHCECGHCRPLRILFSSCTPIRLDRRHDSIAPQCDCIRGLVYSSIFEVKCLCGKGVFTESDLIMLAMAAVVRPAVCRQPIYQRIAFYPLLQTMHANT